MKLRFAVAAVLLAGALVAQDEPEQIYVFGTSVVVPSGLQGVIYYISHSAPSIQDLAKNKPRGTIYTSALNIPPQNYKVGFPGISKRLEWFAIDYTGKFWITKPAEYKFELMADDGAMLYIDDQLVIDNGQLHPPVTLHGKIQLAEGIHKIRVPYFQGLKYHVALVLKIAGPGEEYRVFSTEEFKPPATWTGPEDTATAAK